MNKSMGLVTTGLLAMVLAGCAAPEGKVTVTAYSEGGIKFEDQGGNGVFLSDPSIKVEGNGGIKIELTKINLEHGMASPEFLEWNWP